MRRLWVKSGLVLVLLSGLLLLGVAAQAAVPEPKTPEEVVAASLDAFYKGDFERYSDFMHSEALETVRVSIMDPMLQFLALYSHDELVLALTELFGVSSLEEYNQLSNRDVFAKLVSLLGRELLEYYSDPRSTVLGHVMEEDHTAHVVYRLHIKLFGEEISGVDVVTLRQDEGRWRMLLTAEVEELMAAFFGVSPSAFESF